MANGVVYWRLIIELNPDKGLASVSKPFGGWRSPLSGFRYDQDIHL
ncbi:hypothetical protein [Pantanalinema rosaneae]